MQQPVDVPVGRVEYLRQTVHLLKHEEKLLLVGSGKSNEPLVVSSTRGSSAEESRALLHAAVDLIFDVAGRGSGYGIVGSDRKPKTEDLKPKTEDRSPASEGTGNR